MNELMIQNVAHALSNMGKTMSSVDIAKMTGKRHDHVMRDINVMIENMESKGVPKSEDTQLSNYVNDQNNQTYACWLLAKEDSLTLASGYEPALRKIIVLRWAELEYKEKSGEYADPVKVAHDHFQYITEKACSVADLLGYSEGHKRKEALEIGIKIEQDTGISVVPSFLVNDPQAINPDTELSPFHGTHAALVAMGTTGSTVSNIAKLYIGISPTDINKILCGAGYQRKVKSGQYTPTEKGKLLCQQRTLASGRDAGKVIITNWLYNDNKLLRDCIDDGVNKLKALRLKYKETKMKK